MPRGTHESDTRRTPHPRTRRAGTPDFATTRLRGATSPVMLVVCVVAGVFAYFWFARPAAPPPGAPPRVAAKYAKVRADLMAISNAVLLFREDHGRYPASLEELRRPPEGEATVEYLVSDPVDPFTGAPYLFEAGGAWVRVGSYGADAAEGGIEANTDIFVRVPPEGEG